MIIYIDIVIFYTVLINYIFIKAINILFETKTKKIRIILSLIISVISLLFYVLPYSILWKLRHFYGIIIGLIAFNDKNINTRIYKILIYYLMNYLFVGTLAVFNISSYIWLFIISIIIVIILFLEYFLKNKIMKKNNYTSNEYYLDNISLKTLIDSGNKCYYQGIMVAFLDYKFLNSDFVMIGEMLTKSILGEVLVNIYIGPLIKNKNKEIITYYAFMKLDDYDLIIGIGEEND